METGEILMHQKHFRRAVTVFKQAIELCVESTTDFYKLGLCFESMYQYKPAYQYYLNAISLNATDTTSFYRMGVCFSRNSIPISN